MIHKIQSGSCWTMTTGLMTGVRQDLRQNLHDSQDSERFLLDVSRNQP